MYHAKYTKAAITHQAICAKYFTTHTSYINKNDLLTRNKKIMINNNPHKRNWACIKSVIAILKPAIRVPYSQ